MRPHFFIFICAVNSVFSAWPDEDDKHGIGNVQHEETPCGIEALLYGGVGYTNSRPGPLFDDEYLPKCSCYQNLFESQKNYIYDDLILYKASSGSGGYGEFEGFGKGDITNCDDYEGKRVLHGWTLHGLNNFILLNRVKYLPRSIEDNLMKILSAGIFDGSECPIMEGSNFTAPNSIDPFLMTFNQKMPCGYYLLNYHMDTPDTDDALALYYIFEIKEDEDCLYY